MANPITNEANIQHLQKCVEDLAKHIADQFQRINTVSSGNPEYDITHLNTTVKTDLVAAINSIFSIKNPQKRVSLGRGFDDTDNCYDLIFDSPVPITMSVPSNLIERFECGMFNEGNGAVQFVSNNSQLLLPDGFLLEKNKVATLFKILDEDNQVIKGELSGFARGHMGAYINTFSTVTGTLTS